jgi:hypothetical protein
MVECYSDRLMFVKISAKPVDVVLVQVYMPTKNHDDDEIEKLYEEISEILPQEGRGQVNAMVKGDFNSIVGEGTTHKVVGPFGLGKRNDRGKMFIDFYDDRPLNNYLEKQKKIINCSTTPYKVQNILLLNYILTYVSYK